MLVLHIGAGKQSRLHRKRYKNLIRRALTTKDFIKCSQLIEESELTNTGYGAALNYSGKVECDASEIYIQTDPMSQLNGVSNSLNPTKYLKSRALSGIDDSKHPILRLHEVYKRVEQLYSSNPYGLTEPISLNYLSLKEIIKCTSDEVILEPAQKVYSQWKDNVYNGVYKYDENKNGILENDAALINHSMLPSDTIGIADINFDNTRIAASLGGNLFKLPGRIGCAGIIGAAIDFHHIDGYYISCMCSGNGEDIVMMKLAHHIVLNMNVYSEDYGLEVHDLIREHSKNFALKAVDKHGNPIIYVGVLVTIQSENSARLIYCHSTESFYFGYGENVVLSELEDSNKAGKVFAYGEFKI